MAPMTKGRSRRGVLAFALSAVIVSGPAGWIAVDRLGRNNDFCVSCHLAPGRPLHAEIRRDFRDRPPQSLAGRHAGVRVERGGAGSATAFRCIDCHGGTSPIGRLRVKLLAARDAFWYVVGRFDEPTHMRWPLWDEDCLACHPAFETRDVAPWQSPRFHQLPVHNAALGVACVECHEVHEPGGSPETQFLHAASVRTQCARCHSEYEEDMG